MGIAVSRKNDFRICRVCLIVEKRISLFEVPDCDFPTSTAVSIDGKDLPTHDVHEYELAIT